MLPGTDSEFEAHTRLILDRYADRENVKVHTVDHDVLVQRYLSKVMDISEVKGKTVLELGAGCSNYVPLFMKAGVGKYYANDLVPERLAAVDPSDTRFIALPGDFRKIHLSEKADIIFACLTMMMIVPMFDEFVAKISDNLRSGGHFIAMDANYYCPYSVYRRFAVGINGPIRLFSPFAYAEKFRKAGFVIPMDHWQLGCRFNVLDQST
jgi:SAM-dependent methyltransferase